MCSSDLPFHGITLAVPFFMISTLSGRTVSLNDYDGRGRFGAGDLKKIKMLRIIQLFSRWTDGEQKQPLFNAAAATLSSKYARQMMKK